MFSESTQTVAASPSGITGGSLTSWAARMAEACHNPYLGQIVELSVNYSTHKQSYECVEPNFTQSKWRRVKVNTHVREIHETTSGIPCSDQGVYLCDGVYIHPDDCWF
jgi:hypothetical protein